MVDEDRGSVDAGALPDVGSTEPALSNVGPEMVEKSRLDGMMSAYQRVLSQNQAMVNELRAQQVKARELELADLPDDEANARRQLAQREDALRDREAAMTALTPQAEKYAKGVILAQIAEQFKINANDLSDTETPEEAVRLARKLSTLRAGDTTGVRRAAGADSFEGGPVAPTPRGTPKTRDEIVKEFAGTGNVFGFRRAMREAGITSDQAPLTLVM